ncbi:hypothetical protein KRR40_38900 [Niabella defluvii]|nr:hypothetical protein KRR40_38900 [Niabella sp. I65]
MLNASSWFVEIQTLAQPWLVSSLAGRGSRLFIITGFWMLLECSGKKVRDGGQMKIHTDEENIFLGIAVIIVLAGCAGSRAFDVEKELDYCLKQAQKTLSSLKDPAMIPRSIAYGDTAWRLVNYRDWTSGFWPGILWYAYEVSKQGRSGRQQLKKLTIVISAG